MASHHAIASILLLTSYWFAFTRYGSLVLLTLDVSDICVDLCKLSNFIKWKACTAVTFLMMLGSWGVMRLYIFPFFIIRSIFTGESDVIVHSAGMEDTQYQYIVRPFFAALLLLLLALHIFWFLIFLKMAYFLVMKAETHDMTEHKSGEMQGSSKSKDT